MDVIEKIKEIKRNNPLKLNFLLLILAGVGIILSKVLIKISFEYVNNRYLDLIIRLIPVILLIIYFYYLDKYKNIKALLFGAFGIIALTNLYYFINNRLVDRSPIIYLLISLGCIFILFDFYKEFTYIKISRILIIVYVIGRVFYQIKSTFSQIEFYARYLIRQGEVGSIIAYPLFIIVDILITIVILWAILNYYFLLVGKLSKEKNEIKEIKKVFKSEVNEHFYDLEVELKNLKRAYNEGIITSEEYSNKKKDVLDKL